MSGQRVERRPGAERPFTRHTIFGDSPVVICRPEGSLRLRARSFNRPRSLSRFRPPNPCGRCRTPRAFGWPGGWCVRVGWGHEVAAGIWRNDLLLSLGLDLSPGIYFARPPAVLFGPSVLRPPLPRPPRGSPMDAAGAGGSDGPAFRRLRRLEGPAAASLEESPTPHPPLP